MAVGAVLVRLNVLVLSVTGSFVGAFITRFVPVISLCGRTYQTETAMWGDMFYSATIILILPVTLVLHGLLPLHPLYSILVLLHSI